MGLETAALKDSLKSGILEVCNAMKENGSTEPKTEEWFADQLATIISSKIEIWVKTGDVLTNIDPTAKASGVTPGSGSALVSGTTKGKIS